MSKSRIILISIISILLINIVISADTISSTSPIPIDNNNMINAVNEHTIPIDNNNIINAVNEHTDEKVNYGLEQMKSYGDSWLISAKAILKQYTFYVAIFMFGAMLFVEMVIGLIKLRREKNLLIVMNNSLIRIQTNQDKIIEAMEKEGLL